MAYKCCLVLVVAVCATVQGLHLPKYMKACSKSDPNLKECAKKHGIEAVPYIVEGDKEFHIPNMKPFELPQVDIDAGKDLKIRFTKCKVYGLDTAEVQEVNFHPEKNEAVIKLHIPSVTLLADYDVNGRLLILPLQGNGPANITFYEGDYSFWFDWILHERNGKEYAKIRNFKLDYVTKRNYYHLDNLFNGDKLLGDQTNTFLNENWKEVATDLGPAITQTIGQICATIASNYFNRIPYNEILLP